MSGRAPRGDRDGRSAPAGPKAPPAKPRRSGIRAPAAETRSRRRLPAVEVDRIVVLRVALVAIVLAFLYLVVWIGTRAFGSGAKQVTRIDRVIIDATAPPPPAAPGTDAAKPRPAPP